MDSEVAFRVPLTPRLGMEDVKNVASFLEHTCLVGVQLGGGNRVTKGIPSGCGWGKGPRPEDLGT